MARRSMFALVALAALALAAGCSEKQQAAPQGGAPAAMLWVTRDFGARSLVEARVAPGQDVLTALRSEADVETAYGGRFVQAIDGVQGDAAGQRDWIFYVDGLKSEVGGDQVEIADGDVVWWDHMHWRDTIPNAVVGAFPAPFVRAEGVAVQGSDALERMLRDAGGTVDGDSPWRIVVGSDAELRGSSRYRAAVDDPLAYGVTATIRDGRVLVYDGAKMTPRPDARAVVFAVRAGDGDAAMLAVAGLDGAAAQAAADAIAARPGLLSHRFAAAFDGQGHVVASGGRP